MAKSDTRNNSTSFFSGFYPDRRQFIKLSALGAMVMAGAPAMARHLAQFDGQNPKASRSNTLPGRIVICHDTDMNGHGTPDVDAVEAAVFRSVELLTQQSGTDLAFESLFPGLHAGSTIAIKVNCIGTCFSRWEVARGVVSGLSRMLGGTYDVSNVVIYDRDPVSNRGYTPERFTFNGNCPTLSGGNNAWNSDYFPYGIYELSQYLIDCDYAINIPALKSHSDGNNQITVAMKNHYGSCTPSSMCGNINAMLTLNTDQYIKPKTVLVLTDGIRGTFNGGPSTPPMDWNLYPEETPNTLLVTTDPVTNEYWARDMINAQRAAHGWNPKPCPWIEQASAEPYFLGVSDPHQMTILYDDATGVEEEPGLLVGGTFLAPNAPNPFSDRTTLRFRLAAADDATVQIVDLRGRLVRHLVSHGFPAGYSSLSWDGKDAHGRAVPTGVYFARLQVGRLVRSQRLVVAR